MSFYKSALIIVFDYNETLLDIITLKPLFALLFGKKRLLREWFAQLDTIFLNHDIIRALYSSW